jgi:hypothetical protein
MAVVINEFETTTVQPPTAPARGGDQQQAGGKAAEAKGDPSKEVLKKLHVHAERARRLWAY